MFWAQGFEGRGDEGRGYIMMGTRGGRVGCFFRHVFFLHEILLDRVYGLWLINALLRKMRVLWLSIEADVESCSAHTRQTMDFRV